MVVGRPHAGERGAASDLLLPACFGLFALTAGWFVMSGIHPIGSPAVLWVLSPLFGPLAAAVFWRTSRSPALPVANRRFWRHLTGAALLVGLAQASQARHFITHPGAPAADTTTLMVVCFATALLIMIYALLRLPIGRQTRGDVLRIFLDAGTVVTGAAVFTWHFATRLLVATADTGPVALTLVLTALALLGLFALLKVLLSDVAVIDAAGLRLLALAIITGALIPMAQPWISTHNPDLYTIQLSVPMACLFAAMAAERQRRPRADRQPRTARRRRSFSVLPYAAVAAVDGLLLWTAFVDRSDLAAVTVGAVVLTALVVVRQITALRDNGGLLRQLDHGANHDALTGLPNRALFRRRLDAALSGPAGRPVAVALIDLDDFKEINDTLGHEVGDLLLVDVARRLAGSVRAADTVARLGGDEFVVVLDGADAAVADQVAAQMVEALAAPASIGGRQLPTRASIGIADGWAGDDASTLLRHADIAMYAAKRDAGTAFRHYDSVLKADPDDAGVAGDLAAELRVALNNDELFLLFQPIVSPKDRRLVGAEALVRWAHPQRGTLDPDAFIPAAERTGIIADLDRWVVRAAVSELAGWDARFGPAAPGWVNVNASARALSDPGFADAVADALYAWELPAERITVEITETVAVEPGPAMETLRRLRELGVRISLDAFGTRFSTLTLLQSCPVDELKLGRSFAQAPVAGGVSMAAVVLHLAQALGLHAVAEGTETPEQAADLAALGYPAAQGRYFDRPLPAAEFAALLGEHPASDRVADCPATGQLATEAPAADQPPAGTPSSHHPAAESRSSHHPAADAVA